MTLESHQTDAPANEDTGRHGLNNHQEKIRRCLSCSDDFASAWAGERICKKCRSSSKWRQGYD